MKTKLIKYIIGDILRNRMILGYTILMLLMSFGVFSMDSNPNKGLLSMLNVTLFVVPLVNVIFSSIYVYNSSEFIELLVSQPISRKWIWRIIFFGLSGAMSISYIIGSGLAILIFSPNTSGFMMVLAGIILSIVFVSIGLCATMRIRDKAKGIGVIILFWLYFALLFDGLILFLSFQLADYPLEKAMVIASALNPIDLCRILILLELDVSALMGFTGAVFTNYFGTLWGLIISFFVLILWIVIPYKIAMRWFLKKDL
jgi:Cu-processing system permease protein